MHKQEGPRGMPRGPSCWYHPVVRKASAEVRKNVLARARLFSYRRIANLKHACSIPYTTFAI
jgi:hypothetical protein